MATATILPLDHKVKYIKPVDYSLASIIDESPKVQITHTLPFRVRFTSINIEGYTSTNVPPIPLQVIGYSNYIL